MHSRKLILQSIKTSSARPILSVSAQNVLGKSIVNSPRCSQYSITKFSTLGAVRNSSSINKKPNQSHNLVHQIDIENIEEPFKVDRFKFSNKDNARIANLLIRINSNEKIKTKYDSIIQILNEKKMNPRDENFKLIKPLGFFKTVQFMMDKEIKAALQELKSEMDKENFKLDQDEALSLMALFTGKKLK
ncbi:Dpc13p ASCRUDRAFT_76865 [Ascoidea rubescens DSM 1968]|uniref:Uncharacterized protein n=1 Tax=Ascoidea rubescens DSM 1968 TaxID=1344418 RepID=A0A1D2VE16_9ASCO|nr:hypothetical protein ASCRUDRAFT_76865 [Ascoidea rubescens DSM 1968]ODV59948.1 hypothetical protein ASCRUDRAFT_76865 [Ascoidea rubescens DSM 1968]